jgi:hypothetical protein
MSSDRDALLEDVKAVLAAGRDLPPEYDDALAELLLAEIRRLPPRGVLPRLSAYLQRNAGPAQLAPRALAISTGVLLTLAAVIPAHASVEDFLILLVFMTLIMVAVVQTGLLIAVRHASGRLLN